MSIYQQMVNQIHLCEAMGKSCILLFIEDYKEDENIICERVGLIAETNSSFETLGMIQRINRQIEEM